MEDFVKKAKKSAGRFSPPTLLLVSGVTVISGAIFLLRFENEKPAAFYRFQNQFKKELGPPVTETPTFQHGICSVQGKKKQKQDRAVHTKSLKSLNPKLSVSLPLYAIFDGYENNIASTYYANTFPKNFTEKLILESEIEEPKSSIIIETIQKTFSKLSKEFQASDSSTGTSAIVLTLKDGKVIVGNDGNSRAVLSRDRKAIELSTDKIYDDVKKLPSNLDIKEEALYKEDEFIIMGSDGLWNAMSSLEAVDFIHLMRHINPTLGPHFLAQSLVYEAIDKGSKDNVTAIVIVFSNEAPKE